MYSRTSSTWCRSAAVWSAVISSMPGMALLHCAGVLGSPGWLEFDFHPTGLPLVKRLVRREGVGHGLDLGQHPKRVHLPGPDRLDQPGDDPAVRAVAHLERQVLHHGHPDREPHHRLWIDADDADGA